MSDVEIVDKKVRIREYMKKYKQDHRDHYYERIECECGTSYIRTNKSQHMRGKSHNIYTLKLQVTELESKVTELESKLNEKNVNKEDDK